MASLQVLSETMGDRSAALRAPVANALGDLSHRTAGDVLLPVFVTKRSDGLFVDPPEVWTDQRFLRFADNVFSVGAYFTGLDLASFQRLLYPSEHGAASAAPLRLAADIRTFPPERRDLYKGVRISNDGTSAEYMFAPVFLQVEEPHVPVDDADDGPADVWKRRPVKLVPSRLDFDEFVAHLWVNGVRAGIDEAAVRRSIAKGETERLKVARWIEATSGRDAGIEEKNKSLHRDNSPRLLQNGHIDLSWFKNRFPQVAKDEPLIRKTPRILGDPGRRVTGDVVEPRLPADIDLAALAGPGTRIEERREGQYIIANLSGFVNFDTVSGQLSIAEKIVGREGVSMRTTGNLRLSGENYEEFGEVQEQRIVEGKNMRFHANVYGSVVSRGGVIVLEQNLINGKASSPGGEISALGRASASVIEAQQGKIHLKFAEGCTISGANVFVETATRCHITGNVIEVGTAAGCTISGQSVTIAASTAHKERETVVTVLTPDLSELDKKQAAARKRLGEIAVRLDAERADIDALKKQSEFGSFLALQTKIAIGAVIIGPAQEEGFLRVQARFSPMMQQFRAHGEAVGQLQATIAEIEGQLLELKGAREALGTAVQCTLTRVAGDTVVRSLQRAAGVDVFSSAQFRQLGGKAGGLHASRDRLFVGNTGSFAWQYKAPPQ